MRPETGSMKFGDDWTGVFIRGDNASAYAMYLTQFLDSIEPNTENIIFQMQIEGLINLLLNSQEKPNDTTVQKLKSFEECQKDVSNNK